MASKRRVIKDETPSEKRRREQREREIAEDMANDPRRDWFTGRIEPIKYGDED